MSGGGIPLDTAVKLSSLVPYAYFFMAGNRIIVITGDIAMHHDKPDKWKGFSALPNMLIEVSEFSFSDQDHRPHTPVLQIEVKLAKTEDLPYLMDKKYTGGLWFSGEIKTFYQVSPEKEPLMILEIASKQVKIRDISYDSHSGSEDETPLHVVLEFSEPGMRTYRLDSQASSTRLLASYNWAQFSHD